MVLSDPDDLPTVYGWVDGDSHVLRLPEIGIFRFRADSSSVGFPNPGVERSDVEDAYNSIVLPLALQVAGSESLHASAVKMEGGVVAFCAQSGTGKSTLAYALSRRGHQLWADDVVALSVPEGDSAVITHRLPFKAKVRKEASEFFGSTPREDEVEGRQAVERLQVICVLSRSDDANGPHELRPLRPAHALSQLLRHAFRFDLASLEHRKRTLSTYLAVAARVSVVDLSFAADFDRLEELTEQIEEFVAGIRSGR